MGIYFLSKKFIKNNSKLHGFNIKSKIPKKMYEGLIIHTLLNLFWNKTNWVTEITHIKDKNYFVDEQRMEHKTRS